MNRKFIVAIVVIVAASIGLQIYAQWEKARFDASLPQLPVVEEQQGSDDTADDVAEPTTGGHWHGDEWHADELFNDLLEETDGTLPPQVEPVEFNEPIDYELNPHLLNVKIYSDDEMTRIMLEKERERIRATDPELDAFLVEKDEISEAREKCIAVLEEYNALFEKGIRPSPAQREARKKAAEEGLKLQERSRDWLARFRARYPDADSSKRGEDN